MAKGSRIPITGFFRKNCFFSSLLAAVVLLGFVGMAEALPAHSEADLILTKGSVYTVNPTQPWAEAVAVANGKIVAVGSATDVNRWLGKNTRVIDLRGGTLLPGFQDSHVHLVESGVEMGQCSLTDLNSRQEILAAVREYADENPDKAWITGGGWELTSFPSGNPKRDDLDEILSDRPVFLYSTDGHSAWVNSKALKLAGVTAATPDPEDGRIERDEDGKPSGTLRESAVDLVSNLIPGSTPEELKAGFERAQTLALKAGITAAIDARTEENLLKTYVDADRRGDLKIKLWASIPVNTQGGPEQVPGLVQLRKKYQSVRVCPTFAKIFADGVIEARTAFLVDPYLGKPGGRGKPILETPAFNAIAAALEKAGFQIHVHAIGDGAVRKTLDAFEFARGVNGPLNLRHQVAHLELVHPEDIPRFKKLGVVADFQPFWATYDSYIEDLTEPLVGAERSKRLYPLGSMWRSGSVVAAGSDWSVSSLEPLAAIQVAVTRQDVKEPEGKPWLPGELIDLPAALAAYTINGAYLTNDEKTRGSIEVGKCADLVVLDRNLFTLPLEMIARTVVRMTIVDGTIVYLHPPRQKPRPGSSNQTRDEDEAEGEDSPDEDPDE